MRGEKSAHHALVGGILGCRRDNCFELIAVPSDTDYLPELWSS